MTDINTITINVRNQILNNALSTNTTLYNNLMNNSAQLNQLVTLGVQRYLQNQSVQNVQPVVYNPPQPVLNTSVDLPSYNQLINTFHMFQMMHQMGIIDIKQKVSFGNDTVIDLPDGSKVVCLGNNKYGLIKKKN